MNAGEDRGSITTYAVVLVISLLLAVGLVLDGGAKVEALGQARDLADNAARTGAQQVIVGSYRGGTVVPIDQAEAVASVTTYLASTRGTATSISFPTTDVIEVEVEITVNYILLPGQATVRASGSADTEQG